MLAFSGGHIVFAVMISGSMAKLRTMENVTLHAQEIEVSSVEVAGGILYILLEFSQLRVNVSLFIQSLCCFGNKFVCSI